MPSITINEIDLTSPGITASETDVAFVPGFSKYCTLEIPYVVLTTASARPDASLATEDAYENDYKAYNTTDSHCWTITKGGTEAQPTYSWTLDDTQYEEFPTSKVGGIFEYIDSENVKHYIETTRCDTESQFISLFGDAPAELGYSSVSFADTDYTFTMEFNEERTSSSVTGKTFDKSYIYALNLIEAGIPVIYCPIAAYTVERNENGTVKEGSGVQTVAALYSCLADAVATMSDEGEFDVKYITTGAYPVFEYSNNEVANKMTTVAKGRGDAVALIDHCDDRSRPLNATDSKSVYKCIQSWTGANEFATMFTPYASYTADYGYINEVLTTLTTNMPASYAYLMALADSVQNNANWLAIAGVARGVVPNIVALNTKERLSNTIADSYQPRSSGKSINPITNIKPYGLTIWGNRTLKTNDSNLTATSFLNTRNMVSEVKKQAYSVSKSLLFEQNSSTLWINFVSGVTPLLDKLRSGQGISGYKIVKGTTTEKAKLVATIKLYPLYAVEDIEITVEMSDDEVTVS